MKWLPEPLPEPSAPVEVIGPSGRVIGFTNDPLTADQYQEAGYITL